MINVVKIKKDQRFCDRGNKKKESLKAIKGKLINKPKTEINPLPLQGYSTNIFANVRKAFYFERINFKEL